MLNIILCIVSVITAFGSFYNDNLTNVFFIVSSLLVFSVVAGYIIDKKNDADYDFLLGSCLLSVCQAEIAFCSDDYLYIRYEDGESGYMILIDNQIYLIKGTTRRVGSDMDVASYDFSSLNRLLVRLYDAGCILSRNNSYVCVDVDLLKTILKDRVRWI